MCLAGSIKLTFSDSSTRTIDALLVISSTAGTSTSFKSAAGHAAGACTPSKLLPVLTSIGAGFSTPAAWPASLITQVVDDCGAAINSGSVVASFSNGDPPLSLVAIGGGTWSATWAPVNNSTSAIVRLDAKSLEPALVGSVQVNGQVASNPKVPVVAAGGVLSSGDYRGAPAQGSLLSIFGVALADGALPNTKLPLPQQLGSTVVAISGVQAPLLYVSENQVNAFIPFELTPNAPHQLVVLHGNAVSVPVPIAIFDNQPAILATGGAGTGQGHIYKVDASGVATLADVSSPAKAGDVLVIYCVGLGAVTPPLKSGDPAPLAPYETVSGVTATIGGIPATVLFAGLTPNFSGLYQVNIVAPGGITPGSQVPVTVSVNGGAGAGNIFMAVQ